MRRAAILALLAFSLSACGRHTSPLQNQVFAAPDRLTLDLANLPLNDIRYGIGAALGNSPGFPVAARVIAGPGVREDFRAEAAIGLKAAGFSPGSVAWQAGEEKEFRVEAEFSGLAQRPAETGPLDNFWLTRNAVHPDFAKATNANLAVQAVRPGDLKGRRGIGAPNPMAAVGAVETYQKGEIKALPENSLSAGETGSN
jgi:hypothetical protein